MHTVFPMRSAWNVGLLTALLLPLGAGLASPWGHPVARSPLELRAALRDSSRTGRWAERVLRELPVARETPEPYVRVTRWVETLALPAPDGKPKLVVVTVPGGLALAWARRW